MLCATHDTGSAVEGIPMEGEALYLSSGTWSLLGVKTPKPLTDAGSRNANYSNEGGVGYNRYQKNIMGMWLVNELRRELEENTGESCKKLYIVGGGAKNAFLNRLTEEAPGKQVVALPIRFPCTAGRGTMCRALTPTRTPHLPTVFKLPEITPAGRGTQRS